MYRLILVFFILSNNISLGQTFSEEELDAKSYNQFLEKDFKGMKQSLIEAKEQNIDFYYLNLRAGILAYNKNNFEFAIPLFQKTLTYYPADALSKEYLYYSYLYSGRKEMANEFALSQNASFQQKVGFENKTFDLVGMGGGAVVSTILKTNENKSFIAPETTLGKAERVLNGNLNYGEFFFQNTIKNRWQLNNGLTFFKTQALYETEIKGPFQSSIYSKSFQNLNFQYNLGLRYTSKKEWEIIFGLGIFNVKSNTYTISLPDTLTNVIDILDNTSSTNSIMGSFTIAKRIKNFEPYMQVSASNLNTQKQMQTEIGMTYFPLGNSNFYGSSSAAFLKNNSQNQYVLKQKFGFKISNFLWSDFNFMYGNLSDYNINNTFLTYNTLDPILISAGANFRFYIKKNFQFNIGYDIQQRSKTTTQFRQEIPLNADPIETIQFNKYITHTIKTNLIWNF